MLSENAKLKRYIEELEKEKAEAATEKAELQEKLAELKQIVQTHLQKTSSPEGREIDHKQQGNLKV